MLRSFVLLMPDNKEKGCRVQHVKFGKGYAVEHKSVDGNRRILVQFDDGNTIQLKAELCAAGMLVRID